MELEEIRRKVRIRKQAYKNMIGEDDEYSAMQMTDKEIENLRKQMYELCAHMDEYACHTIYNEIEAKNKLVFIIKKVLRKVCYKLMGWYYIPIIEGQVTFNSQLKQVFTGLLRLMDAYQENINEWKKQIENTKEDRGGFE